MFRVKEGKFLNIDALKEKNIFCINNKIDKNNINK